MKRYAYLPVLALLAFAVALLPATASARHGHHHRHHSTRNHSGGWHNDSGGPIGHVKSFDGTTLVIMLNNTDPNTNQMSGTVDGNTEIQCRNNEAGDNDGNEPGENEMHGVRAADHGGNSGDDEGNDLGEHGQQNCSSALTPGTAVDRATLEGTANGAVFDRVDLEG